MGLLSSCTPCSRSQAGGPVNDFAHVGVSFAHVGPVGVSFGVLEGASTAFAHVGVSFGGLGVSSGMLAGAPTAFAHSTSNCA